MITERQLFTDVMNGLRAAGFDYGDNDDEYAGDAYDTPTPEVSMGGLRIFALGSNWYVERGSDTFKGDYAESISRFVSWVKFEYPDRIRKA